MKVEIIITAFVCLAIMGVGYFTTQPDNVGMQFVAVNFPDYDNNVFPLSATNCGDTAIYIRIGVPTDTITDTIYVQDGCCYKLKIMKE